jgi:uncharacterized surface protein with fasciclin (FAS1) repeats
MKHGSAKFTSVAAAVALACGVAVAQDDVNREGVDIQPRIESPDESRVSRPDVPSLEENEGARPFGEERDADAIDRSDDFGRSDDAFGSDDRSTTGDEARQSALESDSSRSGDPARLDELTQEHQDIGKFVEAVKAAGLADALTGDTPYTVFAPTDEALESMPEDWMEPENREQLLSMLRSHIVADDVDQERARTLPAARTIDGGTVTLSADEDELTVGGAKVVEPDIQAGNLRIHTIDDVLSANVDVAAAEPGLGERGFEESEPAFGIDDAEDDFDVDDPGERSGEDRLLQ